MTAFNPRDPWSPRPPPPAGWEVLGDDENVALWGWFTSEFNMRWGTSGTEGMIIDEPRPSITFDAEPMASLVSFGDALREAERDLEAWLVSRFGPPAAGRPVYALSLNHDGYRVDTGRWTAPAAAAGDLWPVWVTPHGEYTVFVDPDRRIGTFGRPYYGATLCTFGGPLVEAARRSPPPGVPFLREVR